MHYGSYGYLVLSETTSLVVQLSASTAGCQVFSMCPPLELIPLPVMELTQETRKLPRSLKARIKSNMPFLTSLLKKILGRNIVFQGTLFELQSFNLLTYDA